jgi:hypothetical protein
MTAEHDIQNDIRVALSQHGVVIIRTNTGKVRTKDGRYFNAGPPDGWPDLTGYVKKTGKMVLVEVKNERGRLRDDQKKLAKLFRQSPVIYGVCRSAEDAVRLIERDNDGKSN